jgi:hypothetical protein
LFLATSGDCEGFVPTSANAKGNVSELLVSFATFCHLVGSYGAF